MSESLIIKDGNAVIKSLQVNSGSNGYIANHVAVSSATGSNINRYFTGDANSWNWDGPDSGSVSVAEYSENRRSVIISNHTEIGKCYIMVGSSSFGTITNVQSPPPYYSFLLDSGGTYFSDVVSAPLQHMIYVPSSSNIPDSSSMTVTVTQIY